MMHIVTREAMRPASPDVACFYCHVPVGGTHRDDCVLIQKKVVVRLTVEYETQVPANWSEEMIDFNFNESSWCMNNAIHELARRFDDAHCMCGAAEIEYLRDASPPFLEEK